MQKNIKLPLNCVFADFQATFKNLKNFNYYDELEKLQKL